MPRTSTGREKAKRPQLSCNACRTRKVKCDRIQPCTACSLHQVAGECVYDLNESERHPILQAEALREKDKEIARLRLEIATLGGPSAKLSNPGIHKDLRKRRKPTSEIKAIRRQSGQRPDCTTTSSASSHISVCNEAPISTVSDNLSQLKIRSVDAVPSPSSFSASPMFFSVVGTSLLPTVLECSADGLSWPKSMLPSPRKLFQIYEAFQKEVQTGFLPLFFAKTSSLDTDGLLNDLKQDVQGNADKLGFFLAILAYNAQHGLADRCYGQWASEATEEALERADMYIAAAIQTLQHASNYNKPTLMTVECLILICLYLIDSGRVIDSTTIFSSTVKISIALNCHEAFSIQSSAARSGDCDEARAIWRWVLHSDHQYAAILGRNLTVAYGGDCVAHNASCVQPDTRTCNDYHFEFELLARKILLGASQPLLNVDAFTDQLISFLASMPSALRFSTHWLDVDQAAPPFPIDIQAAILHLEAHHFLLILNKEKARDASNSQETTARGYNACSTSDSDFQNTKSIRNFCREVLRVFEYFSSHRKRAWVKWTTCQQAFEAATVLGTLNSMLCDRTDELLLFKTYQNFLEINRLGIHHLTEFAARKLAGFIDWTWINASPTSLESCASYPSSDSAVELSSESQIGAEPFFEQKFELTYLAALPSSKAAATKIHQGLDSGKKINQSKPRPGASGARPSTCKDLGLTRLQASSSNKCKIGTNRQPTQDSDDTSHAELGQPPALLSLSATRPPFAEAVKFPESSKLYGSAATGEYLVAEELNANHSQAILDADLPRFFRPASPSTQALISAHASQAPSLLGSSYPSSVYTNSIPSCFNTPPVSHPVSPLLSSGSLGLAGENQSTHCNGQSITQPQTPLWSFSNGDGTECLEASNVSAGAFEQRIDGRWMWPSPSTLQAKYL